MGPYRCDCGEEVAGRDMQERVDALIEHAASAHGLALSVEFAESAVRRADLVGNAGSNADLDREG